MKFDFDKVLADKIVERAPEGPVPMPAEELKTVPDPFHPADPRPDLDGDARLWDAVLRAAWMTGDNPIYGLLHGLRCGGATLTLRDNGKLHLDYSVYEETLGKDTVLEQWLKPNVKAIQSVFTRAEALLSPRQTEARRPVWAS